MKIPGLRQLPSRYAMRWTVGVLMLIAALAQVIGLWKVDLIDRLDQIIYDKRLILTPAKLDKRIVIVTVDEKSLAEVGRWPWGRNVTAKLVNRLFEHYQIKTLSFDVMFSEPDTSSGYATLATLVKREFKDFPGADQKLLALKPTLDYDSQLAKAFEKRPVVLGYFLSDKLQKGQAPAPAFTEASLNGSPVAAYVAQAYEANLAQLQTAAPSGGFFNT
ncbi:MAG: CHASE2 domain-containing protein, partial [Proteobacteria bacterium]|nr:CHASE2 domain-containing protein [Pseudomonadota bacterium]